MLCLIKRCSVEGMICWGGRGFSFAKLKILIIKLERAVHGNAAIDIDRIPAVALHIISAIQYIITHIIVEITAY